MQTNYLIQRILKRKTQAQLAFAKGQIKKANKYLQKANNALRFLLNKANSLAPNKLQKVLASLVLTGTMSLASLQAATITVSTLVDENNGNTASIALLQGTPGGAGISLREAVIAANNTAGDDIIQLVAGSTYPLNVFTTTGEDAAAQGDLDILNNGSITIQLVSAGANAIIDGNGTSGIIHVLANASVIMNNITLQNGSLNSGGGAMFVAATGIASLTDCTITGNETTADNNSGAGMANSGVTTFTNCTISNNTIQANSSNGAGLANLIGGVMTLNNCTISGNTISAASTSSHGAGISNRADLTINNSNITGNIITAGGTTSYGAGLHNFLGAATCVINSSTITNNQNDVSFAGAIANLNGATLTVNNSTVSGNHGQASGGVICNFNSNFNVNNSTFSGNTTNGFGGAIDNYGTSVATIKNSTISGNTAATNGGGIYTNNTSNMTMTNCTVTNNTATGGSGGGIFINGGTTVNLGNSIVSANTGTNPNISGTVTSQGNNMINDVTGTAGTVGSDITGGAVTLNLGALANNGGNTQTHAVLAGSSAIDGGSNALATAASLTTDQRGGAFNRTISGTVDIGSFEFGNVVACVVVTAPAEVTNTWIGCNSTDWSDAANWSTNAVPLVTDVVYIPTAAVNELIIDETATCAKLIVQIGAKCKVDYNAGGKLLIKF